MEATIFEYFNKMVKTKICWHFTALSEREEVAHVCIVLDFSLFPDWECADHYFLIKTGELRAKICFAEVLAILWGKVCLTIW